MICPCAKPLIHRNLIFDLAEDTSKEAKILIKELNEDGLPEDLDLGTNMRGMAPLHHACRAGNVAAVELILGSGCANVDVNARCYKGLCPLAYAANRGHRKVVRRLLEEKDLDVELTDWRYHRTPIQWAAYKGHTRIVADIRNKAGYSPC